MLLFWKGITVNSFRYTLPNLLLINDIPVLLYLTYYVTLGIKDNVMENYVMAQ